MWFYDERVKTSLGRATLGLVVGSATGTVVTLLGFLVMVIVTAEEPLSIPGTLLRTIAGGLFLSIPIFIVWMIGAFTVGAGGWAVLHALRLRGPMTGMTWVGVSTFRVAFLMTGGRSIELPAVIGVAGIVAGLATWKFSYRRPAPRVGEVFA